MKIPNSNKTDTTLRELRLIFENKKLTDYQKIDIILIINLIEIVSQKALLDLIGFEIQKLPPNDPSLSIIEKKLENIVKTLQKQRYLEKHTYNEYIYYKYPNEIDIFSRQNMSYEFLFPLIEKYKPLEIQLWLREKKDKRNNIHGPIILTSRNACSEEENLQKQLSTQEGYRAQLKTTLDTLTVPLNELKFRFILSLQI